MSLAIGHTRETICHLLVQRWHMSQKRSVTHVSLSSAKIAVASEAVNREQLVVSVAAGREEVDVADR